MKLYLNKIMAITLMIYTLLSAQTPIFCRERIEIIINKDNFYLKGRYYFKNTSNIPVNKTIYYPISKRYDLTKPDSISVFDLSDNKIIPFNNYMDGVTFKLSIPSMKEVVYEVKYHQNTPAQEMEYILTSTKTWNRPIESAEFIIKLNSELGLDSLSMKYDYKKISNDNRLFFITRYNFMPDSNLYIKWR